MIIVDVVTDLADVSLVRAVKPQIQSMMPTNKDEIDIWWETVIVENKERLTKRQLGYLKGKALQRAKRLVEKNKDINTRGEYGSIEVDEREFIPMND